MNKTLQPRRPNHNYRAAMASLEFALIFPLLITLMLIILTIGSRCASLATVEIAARNTAFKNRHQPWNASADVEVSNMSLGGVDKISKILAPKPKMQADKAVISAAREATPQVYMAALSSVLGKVQADSHVFGGVWDWQEIEFKQHSRLTMMDKVNSFGQTVDVGAFAGLRSLSAGVNNAASGNALNNVKNSQQQIASSIHSAESEIRKFKSDLKHAESATVRDENRIASIKSHLGDATRKLHKLQRIGNPSGGATGSDLSPSDSSLVPEL